MKKVYVVLSGVFALCSLAAFAAPASAQQSPCPATVPYFQTLIIHNGFDNFPYLEWVENSELTRTEGSGSSATCYYMGTLYYSHPYQTLKDPHFHWYSDPLTLAALSQ